MGYDKPVVAPEHREAPTLTDLGGHMKKIALILAIVVAAGAGLLVPAVASAGAPDLWDCPDFEFQEDAQAVFDQFPGDPYRLDDDNDGIACEGLPSRGSTGTTLPPSAAPSSATPVGGVQTGFGGTAPDGDSANLTPIMAVIALGLVSGGGFIAFRRRTHAA